MAVAAVSLLPVQFAMLWLQAGLLDVGSIADDPDLWVSDSNPFETGLGPGVGTGTALGVAATLASYAVLPVLGGALTAIVLVWRRGAELGAGAALSQTLNRIPALIAGFFVVKVIQVVTLGLTMPILAQVAPIIVAERLGPIKAVRRAFELARGRYMPLAGLQILLVLVTGVLSSALALVPMALALALGTWAWLVPLLAVALTSILFTTVSVAVSVLAYFDLLDRHEGFDLAERIAAVRAGYQPLAT